MSKEKKKKSKHWHCYSCDKDSTKWKDFADCVEKRHEILTVTDETKKNDSKKLYDFVYGNVDRLVISETDRAKVYAVITNKNHVEALDLGSQKARQWLSYEYRNMDPDQIHSEDFYKNILHEIKADAIFNGSIHEKIYKRIAQFDDAIYYDLGNKKFQVVKITKKEIKIIISNESCPLLFRTPSLQEQITPKYRDKKALDKLADLMLIREEDRHLFKVHLCTFYLEKYPIPIMVFDGESGSVKTTDTTTVKRIVDPNGKSRYDNYISFPTKTDDLIAISSNRYMLSFDNMSSIDQEMSDILCTTITGGSSGSRQLYTNSDEHIVNYRNKIVLNGIVPRLDYPDLQTRIIRYPRRELDSVQRITENEFEEVFQKLLPYVLGRIFKTLQLAMKFYSKVVKQCKPKTRLADFEIWGEAISRALGYSNNEFQKTYLKKLKTDVINAKDQHIVAEIIDDLMQKHEKIEETTQTLFNEIKAIAQEKNYPIESRYVIFPKVPNHLSRELKIIQPLLSQLGYRLENYLYTKRDGKFPKNSKIVKITKKDEQKNSPLFMPIGSDTAKDKSRSSLPKKRKTRHKKGSGSDGNDGSDDLTPKGVFVKNDSEIEISNKTYWECLTHNTGLRELHEVSKSSGNIFEFHKKLGCIMKTYTESEAKKIEEDSRKLL